MPSPVGHALGGIAVGYLVSGRAHWPLVAACAVAATLPDIDFLLPLPHRGPTHSIGAAAIAFAAALAIAWRSTERGRIACAISLAVLSHVLLDWLGQDYSPPLGLMALWPLSSSYYVSNLDLFDAVDRRVWSPGFWRRNGFALARETLILFPVMILARRRRR